MFLQDIVLRYTLCCFLYVLLYIDSCTNQEIMDVLQITALVLSILMLMISVILFAIVAILVEQTKKTGEYEIPTIMEVKEMFITVT